MPGLWDHIIAILEWFHSMECWCWQSIQSLLELCPKNRLISIKIGRFSLQAACGMHTLCQMVLCCNRNPLHECLQECFVCKYQSKVGGIINLLSPFLSYQCSCPVQELLLLVVVETVLVAFGILDTGHDNLETQLFKGWESRVLGHRCIQNPWYECSHCQVSESNKFCCLRLVKEGLFQGALCISS